MTERGNAKLTSNTTEYDSGITHGGWVVTCNYSNLILVKLGGNIIDTATNF
jgi:hypothetical protein